MNVALIDNLVMPDEGSLAELDVHPHLGLLALAASAERQGHTVRVHDPKRAVKWRQLPYDSTFYERMAREILNGKPEAVGFTTLGCSFIFAVRVAAILKRIEPGLPVLLGGPHATMLHREILEGFPQFDVVVRYEADETFPAVLEQLARRTFEKIPGISWRVSKDPAAIRFTEGKPKIDDLDTLPMTEYEHYPIADLGLDLLRIEAGRGCPFNCTFCSTAGFFQRAYRLKSAERLVRELDLLHARYGFSDFKLDHDMFTVSRRKVLEFCEAVKGRGYRWRASARVDCVDVDLLTAMAQSGCAGLYFGIETGSPRLQKISQKRLDLGLVDPILNAAADLGIRTTASFITGFPEETAADQNDTLDVLGGCFRPGCLPQLHILAPEPGTPMLERYGMTLVYDGYGGPYNANLLGEEDRRLVLEHPEIFPTYYYYPAQMPRARYVFAVESVALLRRLGPIVVQYVLRAYDGRLSAWLSDLRRFMGSCLEAPDESTLVSYAAETFGTHHHITSLFRFALRANSRSAARKCPDGPSPTFDPEVTYTISPYIDVVPDLHDCRLVVEQIVRMPPGSRLLDDASAGERATRVLANRDDGLLSYGLDEGAEAILRFFESPRTGREVMQLVCDVTGVEQLDSGFFEDLVRARLIVPAAHAAVPGSAD